MNMKILAVLVCIVLAVMMFSPTVTPAHASPAAMNTIQFRYFGSQDSLFTALLTPDSQGGVDSMQWPLTHAEYTTAFNNTGIVVEPLSEAGEDEIAFNNNYTDGLQMDRRSPMNYTDFRNALNCLVDKQGVIAGPILGGFATQSDTQVPDPLMGDYVNRAVTGANYPWKFNVTHALQILYNGGWYSHTVYPTFAALITAYGGGTGTLSSAGGTANGVVYSGNDPNGQWGGGDPKATANAPLANQPLKALVGYVRSNDARKNLGDFFTSELQAIGCPVTENLEPTLTALRPYVLTAQLYDFATLGYSFGAPPNWWYSELTPAGIYANGPNSYLVDDDNLTHYATAAFRDPTPASFDADQMQVQYILVMESYLVAGYCPAGYCAYKTGLLGQIDVLGQGSMANGAMSENWITLDSKKTTTINYTGPASGTPESNTLYLGLYNPPDMLNPIFQDTVYDFQVTDEMFTYPIGGNPYTITVGSAITGAPTGSDLPWMAYAWETELINDPTNASNPQWTNVTLWFRHDITWQDGVPFTVADINYTIYVNAVYGDAYDNAAMVFAANASNNYAPYFTQIDPYTCSILVTSASWLNLYLPLYSVVPYHLYKYIVPSNLTDAETGVSTDGLHGLWPGQAASADNILSGAPFTLSDLQNKPETTLVGTGPFAYRVGSTNAASFAAGGGITLDAYNNFFLTPAPGAVALKYTWLNTSPSQQPSGGYYKIGLSDLVRLSNAYGTTGTPPSTVSITGTPGAFQTWNPAADLAPPSGVVGLADLITLALHYGWYYGNYSYNAPYPPSEIANGGP
ncbi:MAG: hypothetical protein ABR962_04730 [Candidatus Bathyarchaeia archaeon]|jgi:hypothetical protein